MMEMMTPKEHTDNSFVDEMVEHMLEDWSGLRLYLRQRRSGRPADPTMDTLLSELLRVNLREADVPSVLEYLSENRC